VLCAATRAAHKANNMKGSIYMVFDYMDHDLMGLMQRRNHKMPIDQARC
jgi:cyclin-dependent kinase 12/13